EQIGPLRKIVAEIFSPSERVEHQLEVSPMNAVPDRCKKQIGPDKRRLRLQWADFTEGKTLVWDSRTRQANQRVCRVRVKRQWYLDERRNPNAQSSPIPSHSLPVETRIGDLPSRKGCGHCPC